MNLPRQYGILHWDTSTTLAASCLQYAVQTMHSDANNEAPAYRQGIVQQKCEIASRSNRRSSVYSNQICRASLLTCRTINLERTSN